MMWVAAGFASQELLAGFKERRIDDVAHLMGDKPTLTVSQRPGLNARTRRVLQSAKSSARSVVHDRGEATKSRGVNALVGTSPRKPRSFA